MDFNARRSYSCPNCVAITMQLHPEFFHTDHYFLAESASVSEKRHCFHVKDLTSPQLQLFELPGNAQHKCLQSGHVLKSPS